MDRTICHFEIPADDTKRAVAFYRGLFGWEIDRWEEGSTPEAEFYGVRTVPTDEKGTPTRPGINGMIMTRMNPQQPFANYVRVEDLEASAAKIGELGGQVIMPKTPVPGMGWFLYFKDTEGNILGLWKDDPAAAA